MKLAVQKTFSTVKKRRLPPLTLMETLRSINFFNSGGWALLIFRRANQNSKRNSLLDRFLEFMFYFEDRKIKGIFCQF